MLLHCLIDITTAYFIIIEEKNLDYRDYYSAMEFESQNLVETSLEELTSGLEIKPEEDDGEID